MGELVVVSVGFWVLGATLVVVALATANGTIARNGLIGIRTRKTRASDEAWMAAHVAAKPASLLSAVIAFIAGVLVLVLAIALDSNVPAAVVAVVGMVAVLALVIVAAVQAQRAATAAA